MGRYIEPPSYPAFSDSLLSFVNTNVDSYQVSGATQVTVADYKFAHSFHVSTSISQLDVVGYQSNAYTTSWHKINWQISNSTTRSITELFHDNNTYDFIIPKAIKIYTYASSPVPITVKNDNDDIICTINPIEREYVTTYIDSNVPTELLTFEFDDATMSAFTIRDIETVDVVPVVKDGNIYGLSAQEGGLDTLVSALSKGITVLGSHYLYVTLYRKIRTYADTFTIDTSGTPYVITDKTEFSEYGLTLVKIDSNSTIGNIEYVTYIEGDEVIDTASQPIVVVKQLSGDVSVYNNSGETQNLVLEHIM